jgi:Cys-tRNA(Pro)/Cys-tRNA(Cys) deacylase
MAMVTPPPAWRTRGPARRRSGVARALGVSPRYPAPMTDQPDVPGLPDVPVTPATAALEAAGVPFRIVRTEIARSAEESAAFQGIPVGSLLRSILVRRAADDFFFVLVPGGRRFNWPKLRALLGANRLTLPTEEEAKAETGYVRGAITPFGARRPWPVIADSSIEGLAVVAIGGGARGVNVHLAPADLVRATNAQVVDITVPEPPVEPAANASATATAE